MTAAIGIPVALMTWFWFFAFDSQWEGNKYQIVVERDGKLLETNLHGNYFAFDSGTAKDELYAVEPSVLGNLIAIGYGDYDVEKTDNPFLGGKVVARTASRYQKSDTKYRNIRDSIAIFKYSDKAGKEVFVYDPDVPSEFVFYLRPTFPAFSKGKYSIGDKRRFLNVTRLLAAKLGQKLSIRTDAESKLLILKFD